MARNNEPAFRRKTPLLICSIRTEIPYPCIGSSANVFRMSISSVPWTRSLGLSGINLLPLGYQEVAYASHTGCQEESHKERHRSWRTTAATVCTASETCAVCKTCNSLIS